MRYSMLFAILLAGCEGRLIKEPEETVTIEMFSGGKVVRQWTTKGEVHGAGGRVWFTAADGERVVVVGDAVISVKPLTPAAPESEK